MLARQLPLIALFLLGAAPTCAQPPALWRDDIPLPKSADITLLKDVSFHVIKKWEPQTDGYKWLHGLALAWHKGKLYASFGHNTGKENTLTEEGRYCVSSDFGRTWTKPQTIDTGTESKTLAVSHGVFAAHNGRLWAFLGAFHGTRKRVHTRAYILNEATSQWESRGVVVKRGFWPMTPPIKMEDGNWIMSGLRAVDRFNDGKNQAAVALSRGDDFSEWRLVVIPNKAPGRMWGESSVVVRGKQIINISRYQQQARALVAKSRDFGRTW